MEITEASRIAVFSADSTTVRVLAEAEFDILAGVDASYRRILRLRLERPLTSIKVTTSSILLLSIEISESYRHDIGSLSS